jgi:hypothetical protein
MQPRLRHGYDQGSQAGEPLRRGRHQNKCKPGEGQRSDQPLSLNIHAAFYTVSLALTKL